MFDVLPFPFSLRPHSLSPLPSLVKETEAKEFWEITPATVKSKIATLTTKAAA